MDQQFNYWRNVPNNVSRILFGISILCLLFSGMLSGQTPPAVDKVKVDINSVQIAVNDGLGLSIPGWGVLQNAKGAYLEGYGIVVNVEVAFDPPMNPFSPQRSPEEVRKIATQKRSEVQEKLTSILKQKVPLMTSIAPADSVAIILYVLNTNPAYLPDMPSQIIFTAKRQDPEQVKIREYK